MSKKKSIGRARAALLALLASSALAGCVVTPVGPRRVYVGPAIAPPPPAEEVIGVAPGPGFIWAGGYWDWAGGRYVWVRGRWLRAVPGAHWVRPHWVQARRGWRFVPGHWRR